MGASRRRAGGAARGAGARVEPGGRAAWLGFRESTHGTLDLALKGLPVDGVVAVLGQAEPGVIRGLLLAQAVDLLQARERREATRGSARKCAATWRATAGALRALTCITASTPVRATAADILGVRRSRLGTEIAPRSPHLTSSGQALATASRSRTPTTPVPARQTPRHDALSQVSPSPCSAPVRADRGQAPLPRAGANFLPSRSSTTHGCAAPGDLNPCSLRPSSSLRQRRR